jgi:uncharacterized protein (TIGR02679 family)
LLPHEEITNLFKREKGFDRLFSLFIKKYERYERIEKGISVVLLNPTHDEKRAISGFIGNDYSKQKSIKLTAEKMEKAILKTKYGKMLDDISFQDIVEAYHGGPLVSNNEAKTLFLNERDAYFSWFQRNAASDLFIKLIDWINEKKGNRFYQLYNQDKKLLTKTMHHLDRALALFPLANEEYLAVFASNATGNPHTFDMNENEGKLFIHTLQIIQSLTCDRKIRDLNAEERAELLYEFNIMTDDLLNFVSVFHATGINKNGKENQLLHGAVQESAFFHLPLKEVVKLDRVAAASGKNRLFVIENSSVASHVVNELLKHQAKETILSGNGQFKIATLKFLDAFIDHGGVIYYSGDYDPEGIVMAAKLKKRYGEPLHYWNYGVADYYRTLPQEPISDRRLKQLHMIEDPELQPLIQEVWKIKRSGYQEKILAKMVEDILQLNRDV